MDVQVQHGRGRADARATRARPAVTPPVDILENEAEILLLADVPGATAAELNLTVEHGVLSLQAKTPALTGEVLLRESADADYQLAFRLPRGVDSDHIAAALKDGVLSVKLPKRETARSRRIPVSA